MKLKTNIFLWVFLATVLPLVALVLVATAYSEDQYQKEVESDAITSLSNIVSEMDRRLYYERQMILSLANAPAIQQYLPVLESAAKSELHKEFKRRSGMLEDFLSGFQGVVPGFTDLRVLDVHANTMMVVRLGKSILSRFDGVEDFPYAEDELEDSDFKKRLSELAQDQLSFVYVPEIRFEQEGPWGPSMLNAVYPLSKDGKILGYIMASFSGEQVDNILDVVPRVQGGTLMVAELNPDSALRDGLVLYDDEESMRFSGSESEYMHLRVMENDALWDVVQRQPYGAAETEGGQSRIYFLEYLPYPNQLASWIVGVRINKSEISAPFNRIRLGIIAVATAALLLSIFLARASARKIASPIARMAGSMKQYADGNHKVRAKSVGADEIRQLESSFNYMADTLETARQERDQAQTMMMQSAKLASIGQMAAGIGHEINNPLNNILSLAKLIERGLPEGDDKTTGDLNSLREEAIRASGIVKGILDFARQAPPHYSEFEIHSWVNESITLVRQSDRYRIIELDMNVETGCSIEGDRSQLQQVLINLLLNALQASPKEKPVLVTVRNDEVKLIINVQDQGSGIDEGVMTKVFDPFFSTKPVGEGTGLGLSISLGIVQRHGGEIKIENNTLGGITVTVLLPRRLAIKHEPNSIAIPNKTKTG